MNKTEYMKTFCNAYGIIQSHLSEEMGISPAALNHLMENGFTEERANQLEQILESRAEGLLKFQFTKNHTDDIEILRNKFGIKKAWLGEQIGINQPTLVAALARIDGLRPHQVAILQMKVKDVARALIDFEAPRKKKIPKAA